MFFKKIFGTKQDRDLKQLGPLLKQINALEGEMRELSDEALQGKTQEFKDQLVQGKNLEDILPEVFAVVREAARRVLGMRPYDVQIMGAIVLHQGRIAEMKTGEGKTLTATLALYLNALKGAGAHLVTVNDYLASRDAQEMGVLYNWLGLSVGVIVNDMDDEERQSAYESDITYGTNNEFAFDYLRDNMKFDLDHYVQREHAFCIVDEVDSILIDEARTPLLISGPSEGRTDRYNQVNRVIPKLKIEEHYTVEEKSRSVVLTDEGVTYVQDLLGVSNLFEIQNIEVLHHVNQALKAHTLFKIDIDYVVRDGRVIIVDEFTGRLKEGSRWSDGLHQAVEAKENVPIKSENQTLASITFQNYFRLYSKLAGMTGTADTEAEEFHKIYNLDVVVVPTNKPMIRRDNSDIIYASQRAKYRAVCDLIKDLHHQGQPVLVGTISIDSSEIIAQELKKLKIPHEVLNAKQHEREAQIITAAGKKGAVTIATNMAGRGTDIKLGEGVIEAGGLYILGTERHESRRIDNQLRGRSGRQGDPGASTFFLSLEDDLMRVFGSDRIKGMMMRLGMKEDEPIEHRMISNAIAKAQKRVENHNFDIRKHLLDYDNVMNEQRQVIYRIRREILDNRGNEELIQGMIEDVLSGLLDQYQPEQKNAPWPWEEMKTGLIEAYHFEMDQNLQSKLEQESDFFAELLKEVKSRYQQRFKETDPEILERAQREILLSTFDSLWKDHLLAMDHLKEGINLRSYGQKDPLVEYKREAFELYEAMKEQIKRSVVQKLFTVEIMSREELELMRRRQEEMLQKQMQAHQLAQKAKQQGPVRRGEKKVGRNEPCPCGSGKKFKHCHGQ